MEIYYPMVMATFLIALVILVPVYMFSVSYFLVIPVGINYLISERIVWRKGMNPNKAFIICLLTAISAFSNIIFFRYILQSEDYLSLYGGLLVLLGIDFYFIIVFLFKVTPEERKHVFRIIIGKASSAFSEEVSKASFRKRKIQNSERGGVEERKIFKNKLEHFTSILMIILDSYQKFSREIAEIKKNQKIILAEVRRSDHPFELRYKINAYTWTELENIRVEYQISSKSLNSIGKLLTGRDIDDPITFQGESSRGISKKDIISFFNDYFVFFDENGNRLPTKNIKAFIQKNARHLTVVDEAKGYSAKEVEISDSDISRGVESHLH